MSQFGMDQYGIASYGLSKEANVKYASDVDFSMSASDLELFLAKPDRTIIAKLSEAYNKKQILKLGQINEITFTLPYEIDIDHTIQRNPNIDLINQRYLIKAKMGNAEEWFLIINTKDVMDDEKDTKEITAYSLQYELADKYIRDWAGVYINGEYQTESLNAQMVLNDILSTSIWGIDYIDGDYLMRYRSFEFSSTTVLDAVFEVAKKFDALIIWNTKDRTLSLYKPENIGLNRGLRISYTKYLKTLDKDEKSDEMVTRLKVFGNEGLSINEVNPVGTSWIEDFSYFMYPFERDTNGVILKSSKYLTDGLCNALLDYQALVESKRGEFNTLLTQKETLQTEKTTLENDMNNLRTELYQVQDIVDVKQSLNLINIYSLYYDAVANPNMSKTTNIDSSNFYAVMFKVDTDGMSIHIDGVTQTISSDKVGTWILGSKVHGQTQTVLEVQGAVSGTIDLIVVDITSDEYNTLGNESIIINKYVEDHKLMQIDAKQVEIDNKQTEIDNVDSQIFALRDFISIENNFTTEQIKERNQFIIEKEWSDDSYIDAQELYDVAVEAFEELKKPKSIIKINIVNFLRVIEEQNDWDKLNLADRIYIYYGKIGVNVESQITEMEIDYENDEVNLTIANTRNIDTDEKKLSDIIYNSVTTSATINLNKYKWNEASNVSTDVSELLENTWSAIKRDIVAGVNESVSINRRGITITDPNDPLRFLRATHGVLGITNDGGNTYKHAITADGIVAETIIGKLFIGENLILENQSGSYTFTNEGAIFNGGSLTIQEGSNGIALDPTDGLTITKENVAKVLLNANDGIKIQKYDSGNWIDKFYVDTNGRIVAEDLVTKRLVISDANGVSLDSINGLMIVKDGVSRIVLNADSGIKIQKYSLGTWVDKLYADTDGDLVAVDLIAKRLIMRDQNDSVLIDASTGTIDFSNFPNKIGFLSTDNIPNISANKITSGTMLFDRSKGGLLQLGGSGNGNGRLLVLNENDDVIADLDANDGGFDKLFVGDLISPTAVRYGSSGGILYVRGGGNGDNTNDGLTWDTPLETVAEALRRIPKFNDGDWYIKISNIYTLYETIRIEGYTGVGLIQIDVRDAEIQGSINISSCTNVVQITNGDGTNVGILNNTSDYAGLFVTKSTRVYMRDITIYGNGSSYGTSGNDNSLVWLRNVKIHNTTNAIRSAYGSTTLVHDCNGSGNSYGLYAEGGYIVGTGTAPSGSVSNTRTSLGGQIFATFTFGSGTTSTPPPAPETTKTWTTTYSESWRENFGGQWSGGSTGQDVLQGKWDGTWGNYKGCWFFGSDIKSTLQGKTIKKIRLYVKRASNSGYSSSQNAIFRMHNYASKPAGEPSYVGTDTATAGFSWGEGKWITLPSSFYDEFQNGTAQGIMIHTTNTSSVHYMRFTPTAKLEVTYS